jgi:hypothetical protein
LIELLDGISAIPGQSKLLDGPSIDGNVAGDCCGRSGPPDLSFCEHNRAGATDRCFGRSEKASRPAPKHGNIDAFQDRTDSQDDASFFPE